MKNADDTLPIPLAIGGPGDPPDNPADRDARTLAVLVDMAAEHDVTALLNLTRKDDGDGHCVPADTRMGGRRVGRHRGSLGPAVPLRVAQGQIAGGALAASYDVPRASFSGGRATFWIGVTIAVFTALAARYAAFIWAHSAYRPLAGLWVTSTTMAAIQWITSWRDRPLPPGGAQRAELAALRVVVNVPVYNEAPQILDRCLWALVNQSRPPDRIDVVDDGSREDYAALRAHWAGRHGPVHITWREQANAGKRVAQARTFVSDEAAGIFVTVDSDSALEYRAIENGLAPFTDPQVQSVAGIVLTDNYRANFFTQNVNVRTLFFQVVACGTQSVFGGVLVNRGPLAFYRAQMLRDIVPSYVDETFLGHHVQLGDDAALTLFGQGRGKTVQQSSSFCFSAYPETLSHHLRQWTRWMRGSTIRNCWRIRYLPVRSFGWWFTLFTNFAFWPSCAIPFVIGFTWRQSQHILPWLLAITLLWGYIAGIRCLAIRRSDESRWDRLMIVLEYPTATLWALLVLRWIRIYGIATCLRQGWNTRQGGAESLSAGGTVPEAAR